MSKRKISKLMRLMAKLERVVDDLNTEVGSLRVEVQIIENLRLQDLRTEVETLKRDQERKRNQKRYSLPSPSPEECLKARNLLHQRMPELFERGQSEQAMSERAEGGVS